MNWNAVDTKISIAGASCDYIWMNLDQYVSDHHRFEIAVKYYHKDKNLWALTVDEIFNQNLGQPVSIQMTHIDSGVTNVFNGIVTDVEAVGVDGDNGTVVFRGGSPTILLDSNPDMDSFMDYTLSGVVAETVGKAAVPVSLNNSPKLSEIIPYIARHDESCWAFLSRILAVYGEWFYYDGKKLIVGNPMNQDVCRLTFGEGLYEARSAAGMRNLNTRYFDYLAEDKNYFEERSDTIGNANLPMKLAKKASDWMFPTPAKRPVGREVLGETDISNIVRTKQSREYTKCSVFTGKSNNCGVQIGGVVTLAISNKIKDVRIMDLGSFRVLEVHHRVEGEKRYYNTFKGITALTETLPDDHIVSPYAFQEPAIVIDNADPKNKGRVKVRFTWQPENKSTNWIQVQTPDAGKSDAVPKNRGFFFIPEIGDQVLVGFMHGDPSRPYVMGSLYHRNNSGGTAPDNTIKSIKTRSGHTIEFNDSESGLGITIKDKKKNIIHIDSEGNNINVSANKNVNVTAGDTMNLNAKILNINVDESMTTTVGKDQTTTVGETVTNSSKELKEAIAQNATVEVGQKLSEKTGETKMVSDGDIIVKSEGKALVQGAEDARISKG